MLIKNRIPAVLVLSLAIPLLSQCGMENSSKKDAITVIHERKSVRSFTGDPVRKEDLDTIVRAGMAAPSAVNMQPWSFIIVTERPLLDELRLALPFARMLDKAAAAIVVCALPEKAHGGRSEFAILDSAAASQNILLATEALGLGAVWTAVYPEEDRMKAVRRILKMPANVLPINVIPVGRPTGADKPKDKWKPGNIHRETW
jgi:nitroreductase